MTAPLIRLTVTLPLVALAGTAAAQERLDHRPYPAGYFDAVQPGEAIPDRPGCIYQHDGLSWLAVAAVTPPAPACTDINPYTDPAAMVACTEDERSRTPGLTRPIYRVGAHDVSPYQHRVIVLATALGLDGAEIVLAPWITPPANVAIGDVVAFRNLPTTAPVWREVAR